ncbi:hypothetical protein SAMN05660462_01494 [Proteiniborus ethanoligenes]|uniref:Uncharacterized protein n=1 Tax=Proteiniborus ethanoligenes TaxID=415015 RepID=A0A1H3PFY9_9FIRM|nr:hypothetical protein [Proteiniborus ethanoligenes]SDY99981.1 hypothetical protein SAMN05660462_01494 [Proteiniborus ethanoligenes]
MKKQLNIIFNILIPTAIGFATFFLIFYLYQKMFFEYRWLAVIPLAIVTGYIVIENRKEWKMIKQQG